MADFSNVPDSIRSRLEEKTVVQFDNRARGQASFIKHAQFLRCIGSRDQSSKIGPAPKNAVAAVDYIRAYWNEQGGGYDQCSNIPVGSMGKWSKWHKWQKWGKKE